MAITGTVTRTTEVKPELLIGTFKCEICGSSQTRIEQQFKYTEPVRCNVDTCENRTRWELNHTESTFIDW